jgi:hypothetical protein
MFPTQVKIQRNQIWRTWRPCSRSSTTYSSVMIGVMENMSHSKAISRAITHKLSVSGHMLRWTCFLVLLCGTSAQSLSAHFSYTLYVCI